MSEQNQHYVICHNCGYKEYMDAESREDLQVKGIFWMGEHMQEAHGDDPRNYRIRKIK
jgi:fatty-acid desaturase